MEIERELEGRKVDEGRWKEVQEEKEGLERVVRSLS